MKVKYKKIFLKDLRRLPEKISEKIQKLVFVEIPDLEGIGQIRKFKKIKGYDTFYRIRVGEYRVGFMGKDNEIVFYRALHRKDIYRYFP